MDTKRRKELVNEWKNRCPEMGVISIKCKATEESFLGISMDTKADFNSTRFKLHGQGIASALLTEASIDSSLSGSQI